MNVYISITYHEIIKPGHADIKISFELEMKNILLLQGTFSNIVIWSPSWASVPI